jgi:DNA-directed RNA polymerase subunit RPC12/RpoP
MSSISTPQSNINVDLHSALDVVCESCGSRLFKEVAVLKRVSALVSPTGKEMLAPIQTFACAACNHLNVEFDPFAKKLT